MNYILVPILIILCVFVVVSLIRGIVAFLKTLTDRSLYGQPIQNRK